MGLGRRTFAPGEVLTASNVMNYLMDQSVMNFAGTAARGSAIGTAASEGMISYLNDTNALEVYDGSTWSINNTQKSLGIGFAATNGGSTGSQVSATYADWSGPVSVTFTKHQASTRLFVTGICHYSPQGVTTDGNYIAVQINGSDYQLLQFNSGVQFSLQQKTGVTFITGLPAGTYTAKLRYRTNNDLYAVAFGQSFLTVSEVV